MSFDFRYGMLALVSKQTPANNLAAAWDFDTGGGQTFDQAVRLSATGAEPATHLYAETVANAAMKTGILNAAGAIPFIALYVLHPGGEHAGWTLQDVAAANGLQVIQAAI